MFIILKRDWYYIDNNVPVMVAATKELAEEWIAIQECSFKHQKDEYVLYETKEYRCIGRKFKVGDRVRVVDVLEDDYICGTPDTPYAYKNKCGTVKKAYEDVWSYDVEVRMDIDGQIVCWLDGELEIASEK